MLKKWRRDRPAWPKRFARCRSLPRCPRDVDLARGGGHHPLARPAARERHPVPRPQREGLAAVVGRAPHLTAEDTNAFPVGAELGVEAAGVDLPNAHLERAVGALPEGATALGERPG